MKPIIPCAIGITLALITFICGFALFITGIIAGSQVSGQSAANCGSLKTHFDCQDKCGCGWCDYNSTLSSCQPQDSRHCSGIFDSELSNRCQEKYDNLIIAVIVLGSITGLFALFTCLSCGIAILLADK